jgi:hypothetical protein
MLWIVLTFILLLIVLLLSIGILRIVKKATFMSDKDKEFLEFTISMYINYAKELNIQSPKQHDIIVNELEKIRKRYNINKEK